MSEKIKTIKPHTRGTNWPMHCGKPMAWLPENRRYHCAICQRKVNTKNSTAHKEIK